MAPRQALGGPEGGSDAVSQSQLLAELARPILPLTTVYPGQVLGTVHLILATSVGGKSDNGHESQRDHEKEKPNGPSDMS